jgi:hypothetical protein
MFLPALQVIDAILAITTPEGNDNSDEPIPTHATARVAVDLIAEVPIQLLGDPDIGSFFGEVHVSWARGDKQIVLMAFPDRAPLVHHYVRIPNAPSEHGIEEGSADRLTNRLRWLRA